MLATQVLQVLLVLLVLPTRTLHFAASSLFVPARKRVAHAQRIPQQGS